MASGEGVDTGEVEAEVEGLTVTLETRVSCPSCGHKIRFIAVAAVRINKRSLRTLGNGTVLGAFEDWKCPGCREVIPRDGALDREPYRLADEDAVKVAEYRKKRWGIEDDVVLVEVPQERPEAVVTEREA